MSQIPAPPPDDDSGDRSTLALYTSAWCSYCRRVVAAIRELNIEVEQRDVYEDREYRRELFAATGRGTVPVLRISHQDGHEQWMPESRDIIRYLRKRFNSVA